MHITALSLLLEMDSPVVPVYTCVKEYPRDLIFDMNLYQFSISNRVVRHGEW